MKKAIEKSDILVILDLDETLVHVTHDQLEHEPDFQVGEYFVYKRPHLDWFLSGLSQHFRVAIWSAGGDEYVEQVVAQIRPADVEFEFVWGQSRCTTKMDFERQEQCHHKQLKKLRRRGYRLEQVLIVDDTPQKLIQNYGNAIYIQSFEGDQQDHELKKLFEYLTSLKDVTNVRLLEKRHWHRRAKNEFFITKDERQIGYDQFQRLNDREQYSLVHDECTKYPDDFEQRVTTEFEKAYGDHEKIDKFNVTDLEGLPVIYLYLNNKRTTLRLPPTFWGCIFWRQYPGGRKYLRLDPYNQFSDS